MSGGGGASEGGWSRADMAARLARDIPEGWYVNLGIGLPTLVADAVPAGREVMFQSENGLLGTGPAPAPGTEDRWLVNAGKAPCTVVPGGSFFDQAASFAMIRGGHLDLCVLGAFEVAADGDIANWTRGDAGGVPAVGGAMDLAVGAKRVWALMGHATREGAPRLVTACGLPPTARGVVERVYTDLAVLDVVPGHGFRVAELAPGVTLEAVRARTGAPVSVAPGEPTSTAIPPTAKPRSTP